MTDPLSDIHHYSPTLTIAQVIKFCDKKALQISRPMIQNYIRDGLLPPPVGRLYTHKHLAAIVMIVRLKTVYDIPKVKAAMAPFMDDEGLPLDIYKWLVQKQKATLDQWMASVAASIAAENEEKQGLLLMAHAADVKEVATGILGGYASN